MLGAVIVGFFVSAFCIFCKRQTKAKQWEDEDYTYTRCQDCDRVSAKKK